MDEKREELEEYAVVIDFLPTGKSFSANPEPIAQLLGENKFTLLEAVPKPGVILHVGERVYIGKGERDKIALIKARLTYDELTEGAKNELPNAIANIVKSNEKRFVEIFNTAGPLNIREHKLELFPGIGKRHLNAILSAREEKPFESFHDITNRVKLLQDPIKLIVERVLIELKGESRFYLLTRPYPQRKRG
jgi:putative nucleotide binding protein